MTKMSERDLLDFWSHQSDQFLDSDPSGLAVVCWTGMPRWLNALYDHSQRTSLRRLVRGVPMKGGVVLDIGTGVGRWIQFLLKRRARSVVGIDIEAKRLSIASRHSDNNAAVFCRASASRLPFPGGTFDFVSSVAVLLHLDYESKQKAIAEIARVTKLGGHVGIIELIDMDTERPYIFPMRRDDWVRSFDKNGLRLVKVVGNEYFPLLRLAAGAHRLIFSSSSRERRDNIRIGTSRGLAEKLFSTVLRVLTVISYPMEWVCQGLVTPRVARANGFLFIREATRSKT